MFRLKSCDREFYHIDKDKLTKIPEKKRQGVAVYFNHQGRYGTSNSDVTKVIVNRIALPLASMISIGSHASTGV
jgi:hypothetical protein